MAFAAARMIKDKEAKQAAGQRRQIEQAQPASKYSLHKVLSPSSTACPVRPWCRVINCFLALITNLLLGRINGIPPPLSAI